MAAKPLSELVKELPPAAQEELRDFIERLRARHEHRQPARPLGQGWAGALCDFRDQYTAMELQQKAMDWRSE